MNQLGDFEWAMSYCMMASCLIYFVFVWNRLKAEFFTKRFEISGFRLTCQHAKGGTRNCISFPISLIIAKRRWKALVRISSLVLNVILSLKFVVCMILNFFPMEWIYLGLKKHLTIESKDNCKRSFNSVCLQPRCEIIYSHTEFDCL